MTDQATNAQILAASPETSTWLTANAGSGKTRVLTNRVARLLLSGVLPQNILCLTYTKAAASEMQNRLFGTLGTWSMLNDADLRRELETLGANLPEKLEQARTLFAGAIETPGGLKIQTIHSFCSKILRNFPLEAGVSPNFQEMDEASQRDLLDGVLNNIAERTPDAIVCAGKIFSGQDLGSFAADVARKAEVFEQLRTREDIFAEFCVPATETKQSLTDRTISAGDIQFLKSLAPILINQGKKNDIALGEAFRALSDKPAYADLLTLEDKLLTKGKATNPFSAKLDIPTKDIREGNDFAPLVPKFAKISLAVEATRGQRLALEAAEQTAALHTFANALLPTYELEKSKRGFLDFDDLIRKTKKLLSNQSLQWVLYRLDGQIDHILVDEAQDTSPAQWDVIEALADEMASGATERSRTLFVVGDKKQSIYSFQGADAKGFDQRGLRFRQQVSGGRGMEKGELLFSFRSSRAVLDVVDSTFAGNSESEPVRHRAFHETLPGRTDLWPLAMRPEKEGLPAWYDTSNRTIENDAAFELAEQLAKEIKKLVETGTIPDENGEFRKIRAGDIMILVQRRSVLFDKIIASCKKLGLDVAGSDRLKISAELAVRDILALLSFLSLPEDDLALATALRSPLFGWSEQNLFGLAARRDPKAFLWQALRDRKNEYPVTHETLVALRSRVDFLRPYELIECILTEFGGREKLLARLGMEAEDGIDEFLTMALSFEAKKTPSLTSFVTVAKASKTDAKRETDTSGSLIRVMTVHGAKGLESPIVILPDTTFQQKRDKKDIIVSDDGLAMLPRAKDLCPPILTNAMATKSEAEEAERERLLYVGMTRAEKWLIVCGIEPANTNGQALNWHSKVENGLTALGAETLETPFGPGLRYSVGTWGSTTSNDDSDKSKDSHPIDFSKDSPPPQEILPAVLRPSELGGAKSIAGEPMDEFGGVKRGQQIHLLLEHLPKAAQPIERARQLLGRDVEDDEISELVTKTQDIIAEHRHIFGESSLAEVEIAAPSASLGARVFGAIDRLVVEDDRVLAVDFKTNAVVPKTENGVPLGLLRQMGAYLEALETVYPNRTVEVAILWTATGALMPLGHGIVRSALTRDPTS